MTDHTLFYFNQAAADPTRTLTLRSRFSADWERRVNALKRVVLKSIVDLDCFGLNPPNERVFIQAELTPPAQPRQFAYQWSSQKVDGFMGWLLEQESKGLLEIVEKPGALAAGGEPWSNMYVYSAYQKGLSDTFAKIRKSDPKLAKLMELEPSFRPISGSVIQLVMQQPFHADRLGLLYTRVFDQLKGVTAEMDKTISHVLTKGMADGLNPQQIGKMLAEGMPDLHVGSPFKRAITRGRLIARTEVIHAHAQASLNEYESIQKAHGELILVEWVATKDTRTRPAHARLVDPHRGYDGLVMTQGEARRRIGEPNCRCALAPYIPSIQGLPKKATPAAIAEAKEMAKKNMKAKPHHSPLADDGEEEG